MTGLEKGVLCERGSGQTAGLKTVGMGKDTNCMSINF
jgi:hypothetical protein